MKKAMAVNIGMEKMPAVREACEAAGIVVAELRQQDFHKAAGFLMRISDIAETPTQDVVNDPGELLMFASIDGDALDTFLETYKNSGAPEIPCKAVLTPTNVRWSPAYLYGEVSGEHARMRAGK